MRRNKTFSNYIITFLLNFIIFTFMMSTINVKAIEVEASSENKTVYLTFDDGPGGKITTQILDVLKAEEVPATFFVIGQQIEGQEDTILRMKNEGHSIGLHSFTHKRENLYSCNEGFIKEMKKAQEKLYSVTGENYTVLRFPFGCNNSTYRLTNSLVETVHDNNFRIYDWHLDSGDGPNPNLAPDLIIKNSCKKVDKDYVIVLMHCSYIHKNTPKALPGIIHYYKEKGYTFKAITQDTPELYKVIKH